MFLLFLAPEMKVLTCVTLCNEGLATPKSGHTREGECLILEASTGICNSLVNVSFFQSMLDERLQFIKVIDSINCLTC